MTKHYIIKEALMQIFQKKNQYGTNCAIEFPKNLYTQDTQNLNSSTKTERQNGANRSIIEGRGVTSMLHVTYAMSQVIKRKKMCLQGINIAQT